jgi:hypothetical protein
MMSYDPEKALPPFIPASRVERRAEIKKGRFVRMRGFGDDLWLVVMGENSLTLVANNGHVQQSKFDPSRLSPIKAIVVEKGADLEAVRKALEDL